VYINQGNFKNQKGYCLEATVTAAVMGGVPALCVLNLEKCCLKAENSLVVFVSEEAMDVPLALLEVLIPSHLDIEVIPRQCSLTRLGQDTLVSSIQCLAAQGLPRVFLFDQLSRLG